MSNQQEKEHLKKLGQITKDYLYDNDKRVVNAIQEGFEISKKQLEDGALKDEIAQEFKKSFGMSFDDAFDQLLIACYNTAQYERGLEVCDFFEKFELGQHEEIIRERAELFGHLGEFVKAEKILQDLLVSESDEIWNYISLGDLYYFWQILPEKQDLKRAENWYYKAFDRQLGAGTEDGFVLLERLGEVCVERLRRKAEKDLLQMLEEAHIGKWMALQELKRTVYISGPDSVVFNHLQMEIFHRYNDLDKANNALRILTDAYNLMPSKALDDLCPFQMSEYYCSGEHTNRIVTEKIEAFIKEMETGNVLSPARAEGAEAFSLFQEKFMEGIDGVTGQKRSKLLQDEQKAIAKQIKTGEFIWTGFVKYRNSDSVSNSPE